MIKYLSNFLKMHFIVHQISEERTLLYLFFKGGIEWFHIFFEKIGFIAHRSFNSLQKHHFLEFIFENIIGF